MKEKVYFLFFKSVDISMLHSSVSKLIPRIPIFKFLQQAYSLMLLCIIEFLITQ